VYIILALFLGQLGVHNFYAGRISPAVAQLLITALSIPLMCVVVGFVTVWIPWVWAIIEIIVVDRDGNNIPMTS
jgi:TM2 domain-containing membrane protein YozV